MRDIHRIPVVLAKLAVLWYKYPDWRLGQLIMNVVPVNEVLFQVEDGKMEEYLDSADQYFKTGKR